MGGENKDQPLPAGAQDAVTLSKKEYEDLMQKIQDLEGVKQRMLMAAADFENAKKRLTRERDEFVKFALEKLIGNLIPVLDGFDRAIGHAGEDPASIKGVVEGIQMIYKQFENVLKGEGLRKVSGQGKDFNPEFQEAIGYIEEPGHEHEVVEEIQPAYYLNDRLIRAGKVKIRIHPRNPAEAGTDEKQDEIT